MSIAFVFFSLVAFNLDQVLKPLSFVMLIFLFFLESKGKLESWAQGES